MSAINNLSLTGTVSRNYNGELGATANEVPKLWIPIYQRLYKGKDVKPEYRNFSLTAYGATAEFAARNLREGHTITVQAELVIRWDSEREKEFVNINVRDLEIHWGSDARDGFSDDSSGDFSDVEDEDEFPF
jgi:hypothetical protein